MSQGKSKTTPMQFFFFFFFWGGGVEAVYFGTVQVVNMYFSPTNRIYPAKVTDLCMEYYRKIHYLTREFRVKLHAKTDIARVAKR